MHMKVSGRDLNGTRTKVIRVVVWLMKIYVITGGVHSGCGKGVLASLLCHLLSHGGRESHKVSYIKLDPYWNMCAGALGPSEHGEVYVLDSDGRFPGAAQVDLDFGTVERLGGVRNLTGDHNITMGKAVLVTQERERSGEYRGETIRLTPHLAGTILSLIQNVIDVIRKDGAESLVIELGGTIGDEEHIPFKHALRQLMSREDNESVLIHFVPILQVGLDAKTKPAQHSLEKLWRPPDIIVGRLMTKQLTTEYTRHAAHFLARMRETCPEVRDAAVVMPTLDHLSGLQYWASLVLKPLLWGVPHPSPATVSWFLSCTDPLTECADITVMIYGKYSDATDSYASVIEALRTISPTTRIVQQSVVDDCESESHLSRIFDETITGVIIPGGFGMRGFRSKVQAAKYCISNGIPLLGICMGFQAIAVALLEDNPDVECGRLVSDELENAPDRGEKRGGEEGKREEGTRDEKSEAIVRYMDNKDHRMLLGQHNTVRSPGSGPFDVDFASTFYSSTPRYRNRLGLSLKDAESTGGGNLTAVSHAGSFWTAAMSGETWLATQYHCEFSVADNFPEFRWLVSKCKTRTRREQGNTLISTSQRESFLSVSAM